MIPTVTEEEARAEMDELVTALKQFGAHRDYEAACKVLDLAFAAFKAGGLTPQQFGELCVLVRRIPRPPVNRGAVAKSLAAGLRAGTLGLAEASQAARFASDPVLSQVGTPDSWFPCQRR